MPREQLSPDELISRLSCRPDYFVNGMITISEPAKPSSIELGSRCSSIGALDVLPYEIMQDILPMLDLRSLSRFSQVSLQGNEIVGSLGIYQDLMKYVPNALTALGYTGLIKYNTANTVYGALLSEECVFCAHYGPYLFLPTCVRCCYQCICYNASLWVITPDLAGEIFGLTPAQLQLLPTMRSIPGFYFVEHRSYRKSQHVELTTAIAAKELAIKVYGSIENIPTKASAEKFKEISTWLRAAPLEQGHWDYHSTPLQHPPADRNCGVASIPFPSLSQDNTLENGLWCRGCNLAMKHHHAMKNHDAIALLAPGLEFNHLYEALLVMVRRARSSTEFLEHIKECYGAPRLEPSLQERK